MNILTVNRHPLYVSKSIEALKHEMKRLFNMTCETIGFEIIDKVEEEDYCEVTYHNGIRYETDVYEIGVVEEII